MVAVPHRDRARHRRRRDRAAPRAGLGVADLADPDAGLAVRRRLLSGVDPARLDAGGLRRRCRRPTSSRACAPWSRESRRPGTAWRSAAPSPSSFVVLACFFFAAVYRYAIRTGLIARYSAETVSWIWRRGRRRTPLAASARHPGDQIPGVADADEQQGEQQGGDGVDRPDRARCRARRRRDAEPGVDDRRARRRRARNPTNAAPPVQAAGSRCRGGPDRVAEARRARRGRTAPAVTAIGSAGATATALIDRTSAKWRAVGVR